MTPTSPVEFEPAPAIRDADYAIQQQAVEARRSVEAEVEVAVSVANEYAIHLANGGDPLDYKTTTDDRRGGYENVSPFVGLFVVYRAWNDERGAPHGVFPWPNKAKWAVAERLTETLGVPVSYAELGEVLNTVGGRKVGYGGRPSSEAVAKAVLEVERASDGALVARRAKVDGKVAFLVRERRPGDPEAGAYRVGSLPEETT